MEANALDERLQQLAARLDRLESAEAIKRLHARYLRALADRQWDAMLDFFTEDATTDITWHGVTRGREALKREFDQLSRLVLSHDGYILSSPEIEVDGDGDAATGRWTWHRLVCEFPTPTGMMRAWGPWMEGRYRCRYVRVGGEWKIHDLWFRSVLPDPDPPAEEVRKLLAARAAAGQGGAA